MTGYFYMSHNIFLDCTDLFYISFTRGFLGIRLYELTMKYSTFCQSQLMASISHEMTAFGVFLVIPSRYLAFGLTNKLYFTRFFGVAELSFALIYKFRRYDDLNLI